MNLSHLIRKAGRTAQVYAPMLQELGKTVEHQLHLLRRSPHDSELGGIGLIEVPHGALFLDVGANRGWAAHSIWSVCPSARIEGFEPNPILVHRFKQVYRPPNALHMVALSDRDGEFPLYLPAYRGVVFDGLASLNEADARDWLNERTLFGFNPKHLEIRQFSCRVTTLDSFGLNPFFIKIDVQGREYEVIAGGLKTIDMSCPIIFAESEALDVDKVCQLLSPWRYRVWRFDGVFHPGEISRRNVYLVPEAKSGVIRQKPHE